MFKIERILEFLKENCEEQYASLDFITPEWVAANENSARIASLNNAIGHFEVCNACRANKGSSVGTEACPEACPTIGVKSSNYYKQIVITDRDCDIYKEFHNKNLAIQQLKNSGLTEEQQKKTLKSFHAYQKSLITVLDTCLSYIGKFEDFSKKGIGLYIFSHKPGTGKSHLSIGVGMEIFSKYGVYPKYCNLVELNNKYKSLLNKDFAAFSVVPEMYMHEGLLILDDIGTEVGTARSGEIAYAIIHYRYDHSLPTILTSNYSLDELVNRYAGDEGNKIVDRIRGRCPVLEIVAPSYREKELELLLSD